ncbi:NADH:ubiquinone oxidoreductase complex I intermediate-associated protein 30 [Nitrosococcus halophilus Nc 4]|uniref:NADH:ubiquinone oxidoreductase complex I intermediate-associated protein 30 n=1 Tax=Nitrosococcus halophilus (strain Nc4) TaxID=472759 RepID=D5C4Z8_NITHN|nr:CIA30 family protein [Nitrosococcus halophilus]ADE15221.1 NADH:ubiquinone oxidoreductase complex I intermediate-associated protein 30 [Nitrosococcus halophilus Nc 4]
MMKTLIRLIVLIVLMLLPLTGFLLENQMIIDFRNQEPRSWQVINDGVMGGLSKSNFRTTSSGTGVFEGQVSLANRGGFASVRWPVRKLDLSSFTGLAVRIRGDGQLYRLRLRTDAQFDGIAYQTKFQTSNQAWEVVKLPFSGFVPTFRGRILEDEKPLDSSAIFQVGVMIADKQAGDFQLEIEWIKAY